MRTLHPFNWTLGTGLLQGRGRYACLLLVFGLVSVWLAAPAAAQQRIGYIDSEYILSQIPEFAQVEQEVDRLAAEWEEELEARRDELEALEQEFQARELLYTEQERQQKQQEIEEAERELERLRRDYFGPEGRLYEEQERLMRPVQERVLEAVEAVAEARDFDYVFDRSGDFLFMFAREQYDLSDAVLEELGIDIDD